MDQKCGAERYFYNEGNDAVNLVCSLDSIHRETMSAYHFDENEGLNFTLPVEEVTFSLPKEASFGTPVTPSSFLPLDNEN